MTLDWLVWRRKHTKASDPLSVLLSLYFILLTGITECVVSSMTSDWWTPGPTYVNIAATFLQMQSSIVAQGEFKRTLF